MADKLQVALAIDSYLAPLKGVIFIVVLIYFAAVGAVFCWVWATRRPNSVRVIAYVAAPLFLWAAATTFLVAFDSDAALEDMHRLDRGIIAATLDGRACRDPKALGLALSPSQLGRWQPDHSSAGEPHQLEIVTTGGRLDLKLAQDSKDPERWWLFYPGLSNLDYEPAGPAASYVSGEWRRAC